MLRYDGAGTDRRWPGLGITEARSLLLGGTTWPGDMIGEGDTCHLRDIIPLEEMTEQFGF